MSRYQDLDDTGHQPAPRDVWNYDEPEEPEPQEVPIWDVLIQKSQLPGDSTSATLDLNQRAMVANLCARLLGTIESFSGLSRKDIQFTLPILKMLLNELYEAEQAVLLKEKEYKDSGVRRNQELCKPGTFVRSAGAVRVGHNVGELGVAMNPGIYGPIMEKQWVGLIIAEVPELKSSWQLCGTTKSGRGPSALKERNRREVLRTVKEGQKMQLLPGEREPVRVQGGGDLFGETGSMLTAHLKLVKWSEPHGDIGAKLKVEDAPKICRFMMDNTLDLIEQFATSHGLEMVSRPELQFRSMRSSFEDRHPKDSRIGGQQGAYRFTSEPRDGPRETMGVDMFETTDRKMTRANADASAGAMNKMQNATWNTNDGDSFDRKMQMGTSSELNGASSAKRPPPSPEDDGSNLYGYDGQPTKRQRAGPSPYQPNGNCGSPAGRTDGHGRQEGAGYRFGDPPSGAFMPGQNSNYYQRTGSSDMADAGRSFDVRPPMDLMSRQNSYIRQPPPRAQEDYRTDADRHQSNEYQAGPGAVRRFDELPSEDLMSRQNSNRYQRHSRAGEDNRATNDQRQYDRGPGGFRSGKYRNGDSRGPPAQSGWGSKFKKMWKRK